MAELTTKQRKSLPQSDFVFPGRAPGPGSYPIPDEAHARNALARVSAHGTPAERRAVRAAVKRKFPNIGVTEAQEGAVILSRDLLEEGWDELFGGVLDGESEG